MPMIETTYQATAPLNRDTSIGEKEKETFRDSG